MKRTSFLPGTANGCRANLSSTGSWSSVIKDTLRLKNINRQ